MVRLFHRDEHRARVACGLAGTVLMLGVGFMVDGLYHNPELATRLVLAIGAWTIFGLTVMMIGEVKAEKLFI